ncbi:MAG: NADH:ubiquinone oxidoreductase subunit 6 [Actinomycetia bacterium]|nr:NADH:ubiquinone oxidoreductase subunit 6 [Actinomycetes bacterium]
MEAIVFFVCAALALVGAFGVVLARNPVHNALFLLLTLVTMAVFFLLQHAQLVAIIQVVVYASAIVVLFVFVITLLGVDEHESLDEPLPLQRPAAIVLGAVLLVQVIVLAGRHWVTGAASQRGALGSARSGNVQTLARSLFTTFLWAFELTAVLLVIAVVGGVVLARRGRQERRVPAVKPADSTATAPKETV